MADYKSKIEGMSLQEQAEEILAIAKDCGVENNFFFSTTFQRYSVQLNMLAKLKKVIDADDLMIEKEYVKGRPNMVAHPAIGEYNKTSTAANQTVTTLLKIISSFAERSMKDNIQRDDDDEL